MAIGRFLAGIGALIWDPVEDIYLLLRRSEQKDFAAGAWECITGRVDQGEGFEDALRREIAEEIGAEASPLFLIGTTHFYRGAPQPENELVGVVYCCSIAGERGSKTEIELTHEHDEYCWLTAAQAKEFLSSKNPTEQWLLNIIERAEITKRFIPAELIEYHRRAGFELG